MKAAVFDKGRGPVIGALACLFLSFGSIARATFTEQSATLFGSTQSINSRSASLADFDNDGDLDIFFQAVSTGQRFYRNNLIGTGSFTFTNVTSSMLPSGVGDSWSAAWGDYDGDGRVDVFVGQTNSGATGDVLRKTGSGFTNTSTATGLNDPGFHQNVAWSDIDNDRDLDLIIAMEGPERKARDLSARRVRHIYAGRRGRWIPGAHGSQSLRHGDRRHRRRRRFGHLHFDVPAPAATSATTSSRTCSSRLARWASSTSPTRTARSTCPTATAPSFTISTTTAISTCSWSAPTASQAKFGATTAATCSPTSIRSPGIALLSDTGGDLNGGRAVDYDNDGDLDLFFHDHQAGNGKDSARKLYRNDGNWRSPT